MDPGFTVCQKRFYQGYSVTLHPSLQSSRRGGFAGNGTSRSAILRLGSSQFRDEGETMKYPLGAVWLVAVAAILTPVEGVQDPCQNDPSIAIVPSKDKSGSSMIDRRDLLTIR